MKREILDNLPLPQTIETPQYLELTKEEEKEIYGLKWYENARGERELENAYGKFKENQKSNFEDKLYSDPRRYLNYLEKYSFPYYPRMFLILNHLIRYTNFFDILKS